MGGQRLLDIFKPELGFGLLGEFAHCLNCELKSDDFESVVDILQKLCDSNRFTLTVQFLSGKEKNCLQGLFEKLQEQVAASDTSDDAGVKELAQKYGVTL